MGGVAARRRMKTGSRDVKPDLAMFGKARGGRFTNDPGAPTRLYCTRVLISLPVTAYGQIGAPPEQEIAN